jgi:hypothetical protein
MIAAILAEHGEVLNDAGVDRDRLYWLAINPVTGTWTALISNEVGVTCAVAFGPWAPGSGPIA